MIYITGDTHGEFERRFSTESFPEQKDMTKDDYVIICGDFGGIWDRVESEFEKYWLDWFEERSYTLLFIDGNHENFDRLNGYKETEWNGGRVHEIRPHIFHLMRGQVFKIDGKKIFAFGGASSQDITGGILEMEDPDFQRKKNELDTDSISYRINHLSWWKEELASEHEMEEGRENLRSHDNTVDYIITHCCSTSSQDLIRKKDSYIPDRETEYFEYIKKHVRYRKWFFLVSMYLFVM